MQCSLFDVISSMYSAVGYLDVSSLIIIHEFSPVSSLCICHAEGRDHQRLQNFRVGNSLSWSPCTTNVTYTTVTSIDVVNGCASFTCATPMPRILMRVKDVCTSHTCPSKVVVAHRAHRAMYIFALVHCGLYPCMQICGDSG